MNRELGRQTEKKSGMNREAERQIKKKKES